MNDWFVFGDCVFAEFFASYKRGNTHWKESLVERPVDDATKTTQ